MSQDKDIKVVKAENFKLENVRFSDIKTNSKGGKKIYVNYDYEDGKPAKALRIQMPKMKVPFGISGWVQGRDGKGDNSPTESSNDTLEYSVNNAIVLKKLEDLDNMVLKYGETNWKDIFKKKPKDTSEFYRSFLKFNEVDGKRDDSKYVPRLKSKLYKDENFKYNISVYNSGSRKANTIDIYNSSEVIPKNSEVIAILSCPGIWIVNGTFGLNFIPSQLIVYKSDLNLPEFAFLEDPNIKEQNDEEENEDEEEESDSIDETTDLLDEVKL